MGAQRHPESAQLCDSILGPRLSEIKEFPVTSLSFESYPGSPHGGGPVK